MTLGDVILRTRTRLGLSQEAAAQRAHISQTYWGKLERNIAPRPSWPVLRRVAAALDIDPTQLVQGELGVMPAHNGESAGSEAAFIREMTGLAPRLAADERATLLNLARTLAARRPRQIHDDAPGYGE